MLNPSSEMISRMEKLLERVQDKKGSTENVVEFSASTKSEAADEKDSSPSQK